MSQTKDAHNHILQSNRTNGLKNTSATPKTPCARPGVARAAASAALMVVTTLLLSGAHSLRLPFDAAFDAARQQQHTVSEVSGPPSQMHPDCFNNARSRRGGQPSARRGECWEAFGMQRQAPAAWWQAMLQRLTWWSSPSLRLLHQGAHNVQQWAEVTQSSIVGNNGGRTDQAHRDISSLSKEEAEAWSSFNDSTMAQIFSEDVAWMMFREKERARNGNRSHPTLDIPLAVSLAHLQSIAYCDPVNVRPWNCTRCQQSEAASKFQLYDMIEDVPWDLRAFVGYAPVLGAKIIAFRGTDSRSWYNWAENMRTWRVDLQLPYPGAQGSLVHSGFFYSYNLSSLQPNISAAGDELESRYPGQPWYIVGHSMGAAMATVAALDLRYNLHPQPDVRLYTFGSPRVGNDIFANFFKTAIQESYRFTHNRDIVPSVPLQIMGFHHIAREVWLLTFEAGPKIMELCNESGEDPACHNSVCYLGLCTSIADHMNYLGGHMYHRNPIGC